MDSDQDQGVEAFRRLLREAGAGEQVRLDALLALLQRLVWIPMFPGQRDAVRTVTNSSRETALPVFTGTDTLSEAAVRLGWVDPQGNVEVREITAREALHRAVGCKVDFLVVDLASDAVMEFSGAEVEALLAVPDSDVAGPYAGTQHAEENLRLVIRYSSRPPVGGGDSFLSPLPPKSEDQTGVRWTRPPEPDDEATAPLLPTPAPVPVDSAALADLDDDALDERPTAELSAEGLSPLLAASVRPGPDAGEPPAPAEHQAGNRRPQPLADEVLDAVAVSLRGYPEVEWACALNEPGEISSVGVRVDSAFLLRVTEISNAVVEAAARCGAELSVTVLHSAAEVRRARQEGTVFFPGRRRIVQHG